MPEFDAARSIPQAVGGSIAPRTDIPESEGCFVARQVDGAVFGYLQRFKDGSAAHWRFPCEQAKPASSIEDAFKRLTIVMLDTASIIVCPKCGAPYFGGESEAERQVETEAIFSMGATPLKCRKCGAQISTRGRRPADPPRVD
jgi:hypothetical protein